MTSAAQVPDGFALLKRGNSNFLSALGPLYAKGEGRDLVIALRIDDRHLNTRGIAHGGMLVTLADSALGIFIGMSQPPPLRPFATVSLTADFSDAARAGDWVEARIDVQKMGKRLIFASCYLWASDRRILRASGIFARASEKEGGT